MNEYRFVNKESYVLVRRGIKLEETDEHYIISFGVSHMKLKKKVWRLESSKVEPLTIPSEKVVP